jgi:hypothetical protein
MLNENETEICPQHPFTPLVDHCCSTCGATFLGHEFKATGAGAMEVQRDIVLAALSNTRHKQAISAVLSGLFIIVAAALYVFAPADKHTSASVVAIALVVLALAVTGYTQFRLKLPHIVEVSAGDKSEPEHSNFKDRVDALVDAAEALGKPLKKDGDSPEG